jgi:hypothetical protein
VKGSQIQEELYMHQHLLIQEEQSIQEDNLSEEEILQAECYHQGNRCLQDMK